MSTLRDVDALRYINALAGMGRDMRVTRWDTIVFVRAAAVAALTLLLAWLVTAATDEGGVAWGERAGRTLPLAPVCAAIGVWAALAPLRARGEARALEALGRSPGQIALAAVAGAATVALVAALAVGVLHKVDIAGFYPTAVRATVWQWDDGAFLDRSRGLLVGADGMPTRFAAPIGTPRLVTTPPGGRAAAAVATALAGVAMPLLLSQLMLVSRARAGQGERGQRRARLASGRRVAALALTATGITSIALFQAAAAHLVPAILAALPPFALLTFALGRYRASS